MSGNYKAPEGQIWVCGACGKTSEWRYGFDNNNKNCVRSRGWDESCVMNSLLVRLVKCEFDGDRVTSVGEGGVVDEREETKEGEVPNV